MEQKYVDRFMANKEQLRATLREGHPKSYKDLVTHVVQVVTSSAYNELDPKRITEIDHGDYQGTLLYIIATNDYQPSTFWAVKVGYGSCSGCDTLQAISDYSSEKPTEGQVDQYMDLALHIVQGLKEINSEKEVA